jgi:uncharacterized Zn ribbon protein
MKNKRGQKRCPSCNTINGARAFVCKQCNIEFDTKTSSKTVRKILVKDHSKLQKGDNIRVIGGSGSYYKNKDGEKIYMVDRGSYTVIKTDERGIYVSGENGCEYLYMGEICVSPVFDKITRSPCRVVLLRRPHHPRYN